MAPVAGLLRQPVRTRQRGFQEANGGCGVALGLGSPGVALPRCFLVVLGRFFFVVASARLTKVGCGLFSRRGGGCAGAPSVVAIVANRQVFICTHFVIFVLFFFVFGNVQRR